MNMKLNKKNIFGFLAVTSLVLILALQFTGGYSTKATYIVNRAGSADGDTFRSGWYDIGGSPNVAAVFEVSDSMTAKIEWFYRFGPSGATMSASTLADTLSIANRAGETFSAKSQDLRGYGTGFVRVRSNGDTVRSKIPGANQIQAKVTIHDVFSTNNTNRVRVGIISSE